MDRKAMKEHLERVANFTKDIYKNDSPEILAVSACFGIAYRVRSAFAPRCGNWTNQTMDHATAVARAGVEAANITRELLRRPLHLPAPVVDERRPNV